MSNTLTRSEVRGLSPSRDPFTMMRDEFDHLLTRFWPETEFTFLKNMAPTLDLVETDGMVEMTMDLPGMKPEDIHVEVRNDELIVSGERKEEKVEKEEEKNFHRTERRWGRFSRSVRLPSVVKADAIEATYHDGVLTVKLPKAEPTKTSTVTVKAI